MAKPATPSEAEPSLAGQTVDKVQGRRRGRPAPKASAANCREQEAPVSVAADDEMPRQTECRAAGRGQGRGCGRGRGQRCTLG